MCVGYPSFAQARSIAARYAEYPVSSWRGLFQEVLRVLKEYDAPEERIAVENEAVYEARALNMGSHLQLTIPPHTEMEVQIYNLNL